MQLLLKVSRPWADTSLSAARTSDLGEPRRGDGSGRHVVRLGFGIRRGGPGQSGPVSTLFGAWFHAASKAQESESAQDGLDSQDGYDAQDGHDAEDYDDAQDGLEAHREARREAEGDREDAHAALHEDDRRPEVDAAQARDPDEQGSHDPNGREDPSPDDLSREDDPEPPRIAPVSLERRVHVNGQRRARWPLCFQWRAEEEGWRP